MSSAGTVAGTVFSPTYKSFNYTGSVGNDATGGNGTDNATSTMSGPFIPASCSHSKSLDQTAKSLDQSTIPVFNFNDLSQKVLKNGFVLEFDLGDEDVPFLHKKEKINHDRKPLESEPAKTPALRSVEDSKRDNHDKEVKEDANKSERYHPVFILGSEDLLASGDTSNEREEEDGEKAEKQYKESEAEEASEDIDTLPIPQEVIENYYSSNTPNPNPQNTRTNQKPQDQQDPINQATPAPPAKVTTSHRFRYEPPPTDNALCLKLTMSLSQQDTSANLSSHKSSNSVSESQASSSSSGSDESFTFSVPSFSTIPTSNSMPPASANTTTEPPVPVDTNSQAIRSNTKSESQSPDIVPILPPPKPTEPPPKERDTEHLSSESATTKSAPRTTQRKVMHRDGVPVSDSVAEFQHIFIHSRPLKTYQRKAPKLNVKVQPYTGSNSSLKATQPAPHSKKVKFSEAVDVCHLSQTSNSRNYSPSPPATTPIRPTPVPPTPLTVSSDTTGKSFRKVTPPPLQPPTKPPLPQPHTSQKPAAPLTKQTSDLGFHHFTKLTPPAHSLSTSSLPLAPVDARLPVKPTSPPRPLPLASSSAPGLKEKGESTKSKANTEHKVAKSNGEEKRAANEKKVETKRKRTDKAKPKVSNSDSESADDEEETKAKEVQRTRKRVNKVKAKSTDDEEEEDTKGKRASKDKINRKPRDDDEKKRAKKTSTKTKKRSSLEDEEEEEDEEEVSRPKKRQSRSNTTSSKKMHRKDFETRKTSSKRKTNEEVTELKRKAKKRIPTDDEDEEEEEEELGRAKKTTKRRRPEVDQPRTREVKPKSKEEDDELFDSDNSPEEGTKRRRAEDEDTEDMYAKYETIEDSVTSLSTSPHSSKKGPLFSGFVFIVTGIKKSKRMTVPWLKDLIKANGGKLVDDVIHIPISPIKRIYKKGIPKTILLSDRDRKTIKYMLGLASGTPCLHYNWLTHCLEKHAILPYEPYLLPIGFSTSKNCIIHREGIPYQNYVFDGCRIELFGPLAWQEQWSRVLKEAGAKIVKRLFSESADRLDYILSNSAPEQDIKDRAESLGLSVTSIMWVIECVLVQELLPLDVEGYTF